MQKVRVLVVDDSAVFRTVLKSQLALRPGIEVVGVAQDAYEARDLIVQLEPDVITLDLDMPKMGGLEFIEVLMEHWPIPIVVVSSYSAGEERLGAKALEAGAMAIFDKPTKADMPAKFDELANILISLKGKKPRPKPKAVAPGLAQILAPRSEKVIVIGASTGGTEAIKEVLIRMPANCPGIVMVQHMPHGFTRSFADRLNELSPNLSVREAVNGEIVQPGLALLAPGDQHMELKYNGRDFYVALRGGEPVNRHKPSVDVIFDSAAEVAGKKAIGVILTGMGADGANGLLRMKQAGAKTIAQSERTCVVYGMPKEAVNRGAADQVVDLEKIAEAIMKLV